MPKIFKDKWPILLIFLISLGLFVYFTWLVEPASAIKNLLISNITDHQASISWTTDIPTKAVMMVSSNNKFPILPIFSSNLQKDDEEKYLPKVGRYTTHHLTIGNLSSSKRYYFRIYQGQKKVFEGRFATGPTLSTLISSNPVYGKVLKENKKPVIGAIIYLKVIKEASQSALLSTLTNGEGGWTIDLANLRDSTLKKYYSLSKTATEQIIVEAGNLGRVKTATISGQDKPWSDILVK